MKSHLAALFLILSSFPAFASQIECTDVRPISVYGQVHTANVDMLSFSFTEGQQGDIEVRRYSFSRDTEAGVVRDLPKQFIGSEPMRIIYENGNLRLSNFSGPHTNGYNHLVLNSDRSQLMSDPAPWAGKAMTCKHLN